MRVIRRVAVVVMVIGGCAASWQALHADRQKEKSPQAEDELLWLEDVHGAKPLAWVKEQNAKALAVLTGDPDYRKDYDSLLAVLDATDRIPFAALDHQYAFNFWQDAAHPKGVWRRTSIADYAKPEPPWEVLIDLDTLANVEKENWVWKGADCAPSLTRCLVRLSRGGGDANVVREFDLKSRRFVSDGFSLPEAKSDAAYIDDDAVLFATDFGKGSLTNSGYARIVKLWKRGTAVAGAQQVAEGKIEDVAVSAFVSRTASGNIPLVVRSPSFFEGEYFHVKANGTTAKLPLPLSAEVKGITQGQVVFTLRKDWQPQGAAQTFKNGSLVAFPFDQWAQGTKTGTLPAGICHRSQSVTVVVVE